MDAVRSEKRNFEPIWDETITFWKNFVANIKEENPSSYTIGEVTDLWGLYDPNNPVPFGKYKNPDVAERMFLEETGITTNTNYSHAFSSIPALFGQVFEDGSDNLYANMNEFKTRMENYLQFGPYSMITQSHIALNNHDKPRPLHCLAVDGKLFLNGAYLKDWMSKGDIEDGWEEIRARAKKMFPNENPESVSSKAVAVCEIFIKNINKVVEDEETKELLIKTTKELALGKKNPNDKIDNQRADAFACDDFEVTLKEIFRKVEKHYLESGDVNKAAQIREQRQSAVDEILKGILEIPMERYSKMWELMATMFGNPTLYAGDEYGQSGFENSSGNSKVKNRNLVRHDILKNPARDDVKAYNAKINAISRLHNKKGLSALAGGAPVSLDQESSDLWAIYKNNDKGSEVISLYSTVGLKRGWDEKSDKNPEPLRVDCVKLGNLAGGINAGTNFSRLVYDEQKGDYVDEGVKYITKKGENGSYSLVREDGEPIEINSTTTVFYKKNPTSKVDVLNLKYNI